LGFAQRLLGLTYYDDSRGARDRITAQLIKMEIGTVAIDPVIVVDCDNGPVSSNGKAARLGTNSRIRMTPRGSRTTSAWISHEPLRARTRLHTQSRCRTETCARSAGALGKALCSSSSGTYRIGARICSALPGGTPAPAGDRSSNGRPRSRRTGTEIGWSGSALPRSAVRPG